MSYPTRIRLLERDPNNRPGDLFRRLTKELFLTLGYDNLRINVDKSGRALEVQGDERFKHTHMMAMCKVDRRPADVGEVNEFLRALMLEQEMSALVPVTGYLVSLGGFTGAALKREIETGHAVALLDAQRVVAELESHGLIPGLADAVKGAARCAERAGLRDAVSVGAELVADDFGYAWAIFYAPGGTRTHLALIGDGGRPLDEAMARQVVAADRLCGGALHTLRYLAPPAPEPTAPEDADKYRSWLRETCGYIQLDGLPADTDLSRTNIRLESLFVPLHLDLEGGSRRQEVGAVLAAHKRLVLLGPPGAGKSTLLKRLVMAYAFPERGSAVSEGLPQRNWLPLLLRCRDLRAGTHQPIVELLDDLAHHSGMSADEIIAFRKSVRAALLTGRALLLVDGLDEITGLEDRLGFINDLEAFINAYPAPALIVTARERDSGHLAGRLGETCARATISPFNEVDIRRLTTDWHREVVGATVEVIADAGQFAETIIANEGTRSLAANPLLLTTLLVVRRWIGELPRSRAALYREAIRILVRTWNVEGYEPLDEEETLVQLSYVACAMMQEGQQRIGQRALLKSLQAARRELEAELQFARISPQEFIERIEYRSGLLMLVGHERVRGALEPVYEFRHLVFQEYLAACGYAEGQYPEHRSGQSLGTALEPYFGDARWREVIRLAAALGGKASDELVRRLTGEVSRLDEKQTSAHNPLLLVLGYCLADEVPAQPATVRAALGELARFGGALKEAPFMAALVERPYAQSLIEAVAEDALGQLSEVADKEEQAARDELMRFEYEPARQYLEAAMSSDPEREGRLRDEFGFLLASPGDDAVGAADRLRWCTEVWYVLSKRNQFALLEAESDEDEITAQGEAPSAASSDTGRIPSEGCPARPEEKGEQLELAVERLFRSFFHLGKDIPWKIRRQRPGTQGGFDLSIEWSGEAETEHKVRCHIECKNYKDKITLADVADKLLSEPWRNPTIDHWILISPRANPSNELNRLLEAQESEGPFPFNVQVWCPETGVNELFGLEPGAYDALCIPCEGEPHPSTWDQAKRKAVQAKWRERLKPFLRLPKGWDRYVREPAKLCIHKETPEKMEEAYKNFVQMGCRNSAGLLLDRSLEKYVDEWLAAPEQPVLFLLGEFGDGKSFFTYLQARRLLAQWLEDRSSGWLPLRLALSKYPGNAREFLRRRLEDFEAEVGGWQELGKVARRVVMLDGFDEMSSELDPETLTQNIKALLECAEELEGCKILITSRTHFFQNKKDAQRLLSRLGNPPTYHLAPIPRKRALENLFQTFPDHNARQELLRRIESMNDPIGLAGKPLFLEMLKEVLRSPNLSQDLDVVTLYEQYIDQSLRRKPELLDDPKLQVQRKEIFDNLRDILGEIATELQRTGQPHVNLNRIEFPERKPFAELLWHLSDGEGLNEDAKSRVGARSLLARVVKPETEDEGWPVDFCHRSMREYFVSIRLCWAVEQAEEVGAKFLQEVPLNHEILDFAVERWRKAVPAVKADVKERLLAIIRRAVPANNPGRMGGHALTLFYRLEPQLPREFNWTGKFFNHADLEEADLSGLNFQSCSFRYANLANVNFENSNFEGCDLTGVRIEETTHVVSIGVDSAGEHLVAAYGDNLLRHWFIGAGRKTSSKVVGNVRVEPSAAIGIHKTVQPWMRIGPEWRFFNLQPDQTWKLSTRFPVKDVITESRLQGHLMTLTEKNDGGSVLISLVDLPKQARLGFLRADDASHCASLGTEAVAYIVAGNEVHVRSFGRRKAQREIKLQCTEPSCLDVLSLETGKHLLAVGAVGGRVHVWELDLRAHAWSSQKVLEVVAHEGLVTGVLFLGEKKLATSSSDRSIAIINRDESDYASGKVERRLVLKLRCKGMKIKGLQPEAERALLAKLIGGLLVA